MKFILLLACGCSLLFATGCLYSSQEWRGHANNARFGGIALGGPPPVELRTTVGAVRPQGIVTR
jgi:hypothetical protein